MNLQIRHGTAHIHTSFGTVFFWNTKTEIVNISCSCLPFPNIIHGPLNSSEQTLEKSFRKRAKYPPLPSSPDSINLSLPNVFRALLQKTEE